MTDITELAQSLKAAAEKATQVQKDIRRFGSLDENTLRTELYGKCIMAL